MSWGIVAGAAISTVGGALLGSKGQKQTSETQKTMDPAMRPYIFGGGGQQGLLPMGAQQLLDSRSPARMAQHGQVRDRGFNLLGGSIAGNPFTQPGGYRGVGSLGGAMGGNGMPQMQMPQQQAPAPQQPQAQQPAFDFDALMAEYLRRQQEQAQQSNWLEQVGGAGNGGDSSGDSSY